MRVAALRKETRRGRPMAKTPYREKLKALRTRAGLTGADMAKSLGYASPAGYFKHEQEIHQGDRPIAESKVQRMVPLFLGRGTPPITAEEIWALTEKSEVPKQVKTTDEKGLLIIRYRVEPGTFTRRGPMLRMLGASRLSPSNEYDTAKQFVAIDVNGDQLHCVEGVEVEDGKRCVLAVAYDTTELVEIVVAEAAIHKGGIVFVTPEGVPVNGEVLGVVVGSYVKE